MKYSNKLRERLRYILELSEWLLFNAKWSAIISYVMARTSCIRWDDNDVRIVLEQRPYLEFNSSS